MKFGSQKTSLSEIGATVEQCCFDHFIKMEVDRTNVEGSNETHGKESIGPISKNINTLIVFEHILVLRDIGWHYWLEIANNMPSIVGCKIPWRVISMIVLRCQVDYYVHEFVSTSLAGVNNALSHGDALVLISFIFISLEAKQELIKTV